MKIDKDVSIKNIKSFYKTLREEIENNNQVILDFSDSVRIDSSTAQIILAAVRKVKDLNKTIRFIGVSPELRVLLKLAGVKRQ